MSVADALSLVKSKMTAVISANLIQHQVRLVAVSKFKPLEAVIEAAEAGQNHFGENYVQELFDKATNTSFQQKYPDIKWHFIGNLQRNKINKLLNVPNLYAVETIDSEKIAEALNRALIERKAQEPLRIFVQVNTSNETNKNGLDEKEVFSLVKKIITDYTLLKFMGLMTIGSLENTINANDENPDFKKLFNLRNQLAEQLSIPVGEIELSMGMSADFEIAIKMGSTNVRVGSIIFGARDYGKK